ncbi:MAG: hypothetical protein IPJ45_09065 [Ignavibacteria bacterium]|nr:hypothetical protein [Ignavibacteria bacterium]
MANYFSNPFLPAPSKADAWEEGFTKGFISLSSPDPSENIDPDDYDAFNKGVAMGIKAADEGISLKNECIAAIEGEGPEGAMTIVGAGELLHFFTHATLAGFAGVIAHGLVFVYEHSVVYVVPPEQTVLPKLGEIITGKINSYGIASMELFCGVGIDAASSDCTLKLTPLFSSLEKTRTATVALGRSESIIVSWRTDQSNSFQVVE